MNAAIASPATPVTEEQSHLLRMLLRMPLFAVLGLLALGAQTLAIILLPIGALGYGGFCLARHLKNSLLA
jgi:hypothetical protein